MILTVCDLLQVAREYTKSPNSVDFTGSLSIPFCSSSNRLLGSFFPNCWIMFGDTIRCNIYIHTNNWDYTNHLDSNRYLYIISPNWYLYIHTNHLDLDMYIYIHIHYEYVWVIVALLITCVVSHIWSLWLLDHVWNRNMRNP